MYSELTIKITKQLSKQEKKEFGIFITPHTIIEKLTTHVLSHLDKIDNISIIEPSCGTCEFVKHIDNRCESSVITAIEFNPTIFEEIKSLEFKNSTTIMFQDFIKYKHHCQVDLIIGNPPYFVCKKEIVPNPYVKYMIGRPNIFGIFILHSLSLLKEDGGILAFIVPTSLLNAAYYSKIREYIHETCDILNIISFDDAGFLDTQQKICGLILRRRRVEPVPLIAKICSYSLKINNTIIFTNDNMSLQHIFNGSKTITQIGCKVKTGNIVWNEKKELLTGDETATLLLYNSNISKTNTIEMNNFKNDEKKQYINMTGKREIVIVVNRGNGNAAYKLTYAIVDMEMDYLVENHLNIIYYDGNIDNHAKRAIYSKIIESFQNEKTQLFIKMFLGNNVLSKTELETIFPIYGF
jgi:hypothetical protein